MLMMRVLYPNYISQHAHAHMFVRTHTRTRHTIGLLCFWQKKMHLHMLLVGLVWTISLACSCIHSNDVAATTSTTMMMTTYLVAYLVSIIMAMDITLPTIRTVTILRDNRRCHKAAHISKRHPDHSSNQMAITTHRRAINNSIIHMILIRMAATVEVLV